MSLNVFLGVEPCIYRFFECFHRETEKCSVTDIVRASTTNCAEPEA
jgi:hypothetical protein